ncbi:MAG: FAD-dependent monooxygenase [Pyrinomonadaceae bacterium]
MQTDVIVAGSGPTGLSLALQLMRYGIDFVSLDKREGTSLHSKAIGIQARTLEIYDQMGIADEVVGKGWRADRVRLLGGGEVRGEIDLTDIGTGMSPFPFLLILEQGIHEDILYRKLIAVGSDVLWNTELVSFEQSAEGVTAQIRRPDGTSDSISAKYLVGCDGAHSLVRHSLGLGFGGSTFERLFYVADVELDWAFKHDALHVNLGENTITAFFPMKGENRWRLVGTFPEGHEKDENDILFDEIEAQVALDTSLTFDVTAVHWHSVYKVHSRAVERFSSGRCFLAGDAAHIHTPAGAQGMNTGIQDGYNLAWKLAAVIKHGAGANILDTYNEERLPNARRLLATTDRFFDFAASEDWLTSFLRKNIFPFIADLALSFDAVKRIVFPIVSQIGINYRDSSMSGESVGFEVHAGDRMPWFTVGGESIYDRLSAAKFQLLLFNADDRPSDDLLTRAGSAASVIDTHSFALNEEAASIFGCDETFAVLLRPDNYIALITRELDPSAVIDHLRKIGLNEL